MGNGVYFKMFGCCQQERNLQGGDLYVDKNSLKNTLLINANNLCNEEETHKKDQKIISTKSKQSSGSGSYNKGKQIYIYENSSNKDQNMSICNNTMQMNNSNLKKNNLTHKKSKSYSIDRHSANGIDEVKYKGSTKTNNKINNSNSKDILIDIKTKLLLTGDLFSKNVLEINKYGLKNGLRHKNDSMAIFGIKENNKNGQNNCNFDYYLDSEKFDENSVGTGGKVFEIFINKRNKAYTLYFLHNSLILYYKINKSVFFESEKDYYLILGDIFLTIIVKKKPDNKEKIIQIQTEIENEKPNKFSFEPKDMPIKIGRVNCHINIPRPSISKIHSVIDFSDDDFYYKDWGSTNGTTLLIREDDSLKLNGEMSFKLEDISFKIKEVDDEENYIEENFGE